MVHDGIFLGFLTIFCVSGVFLNASMLAQKGVFLFHHNTVTTIEKNIHEMWVKVFGNTVLKFMQAGQAGFWLECNSQWTKKYSISYLAISYISSFKG